MLKCKMCNKWRGDISIKSNSSLPSIAQWKQAMVSLRKITDQDSLINFGGGEPFLMKDILELVSFAFRLGFKTNIATNAYLIDQDLAKRIADSGLTTINISLDSHLKKTHDFLRGVDGVYEKAFLAVDNLHKFCPNLKKGICSVIYGINLEEILFLVEFIENDQRLEWIYFMAAMQPNNTPSDPEWYKREQFNHLWPKDAGQAALVINKLIELKRRGYKIVNQVSQLRAFAAYFSSPHKFVKTIECNLSRAIHISSVGDVFICFSHDRLGNIKTETIEELWYSDRALTVRKKIADCRNNCHFLINCFFEGDFPFEF